MEDDIQMTHDFVDHPKPKKLERRNAVSGVETHGLGVTQGEAELPMPGVETVTTGVRGVTILHSLPVSVDLDPGRRLGPRAVHTQCPHCRHFIITRTEATFGLFACISSGLCCLSG